MCFSLNQKVQSTTMFVGQRPSIRSSNIKSPAHDLIFSEELIVRKILQQLVMNSTRVRQETKIKQIVVSSTVIIVEELLRSAAELC